MRIITWNLHLNHGSVALPQLQAGFGADLILLQESAQPAWQGSFAWKNVPNLKWGSAVLASSGRLLPTPIVGYDGWVVGGELINSTLNSPGRSLFVFSVHAPTGSPTDPRGPYIDEVVSVLDLIGMSLPSQADLILGGDFNFVSLGNRKPGEAITTTAAEQEALTRFAQLGLISCWATAHPGRALAQTLRWSGDTTPDRSTPYHPDGIFVPDTWRSGIICEILTSATFEVSDHYPVAALISP